MGLSIKVSLLTSLCFIGTMCWLVNQVGKPMVELPSPLTGAISRPPAGADPLRVESHARGGFDRGQSRFERSSPAQRTAPAPAPLAAAPSQAVESPGEAPPLVGPGRDVVQVASAERLAEAVQEAREAASSPPEGPAPALATETPAPTPPAIRDPLAEAQPAPGPREYVVQKGDSLTRIARRQAPERPERMLSALLKANPALKGRGDLIRTGETLVIPDLSEPAVASASDSGPTAAPADAPGEKPAGRGTSKSSSLASAKARPKGPTRPEQATTGSRAKMASAVTAKPAVVKTSRAAGRQVAAKGTSNPALRKLGSAPPKSARSAQPGAASSGKKRAVASSGRSGKGASQAKPAPAASTKRRKG